MADQNRKQQSNQNPSSGQQGQENEPRRTSNQGNQESQQGRSRDDESTGMSESRERSNREPTTMANDRGAGERQSMRDTESESLDSEGIESDLDSETEIDEDEDVEGGSNR